MATIRNPIIRGSAPDPCACVGHDGAFYIAVSTFEWFPGVNIYRSADLVSWALAAAPLDRLSQLSMEGESPSAGIWAPALSWADGKYWLLYTDTKNWHGEPRIGTPLRDQYNYLVTAERIEGPWSDPIFLTGGGYDPSLFHDDDGRKYLAYARRDYRRPDENVFEGIMLQEYDAAAGKLVGDCRPIYRGANLPIDYFIKSQIYEGPHIHKREGLYYLITAEGGVGSTHATCVSRSRSLWGPYEPHPERHPFLTASGSDGPLKRAGHGNIFTGPGGRDYMTFLCARPVAGSKRSPLGRETGLAPIEWRGGWPYLAGASGASNRPPEFFEIPDGASVQKGAAGSGNGEYGGSIDFSSIEKLPLELQSLRVPFDPSWCSLGGDRPGFFRMYGRDSPVSRFRQSMAARRIRDFSFEAETELEFDPECHLQFAGLMLRYDESAFFYIHVTRIAETGEKVIAYMEQLDGAFQDYRGRIAVLEGGLPLSLRAVCHDCSIRFSWSQGGGAFVDCGLEKDLCALSDEAMRPIGFTGAFAAIAASDMLGKRTPADFKRFDYRSFA
jgi:xylan 1,4-beta-xylosidase